MINPDAMIEASPLLELRGLTKIYQRDTGPCIANENVSLLIEAGKIHALVGENGAGKSTLMKMLFGLVSPSSGSLFHKGCSIEQMTPSIARSLGIGMVQQHFLLAGSVTALDHLFLEEEARAGFWKSVFPLNRRSRLSAAEKLAAEFNLPLPWKEKVENLSVGYQQRLELLKLLFRNCEILIFDEPLALLSPKEIEIFLEHLKFLRSKGKTIVLITHKLSDVFKVADQISILRAGRKVHTGSAKELTEASVAAMMVGADHLEADLIGAEMDSAPRPQDGAHLPSNGERQTRIRVSNLSARFKDNRPALQDISFELQSGEILGIAGVEGQGQVELLQLLLSRLRPTVLASHLRYSGEIEFPASVQASHSYVGEDRLSQSVIADLSITENMVLGHESVYFSAKSPLQPFREKYYAAQVLPLLQSMNVQPPDPKLKLRQLSGGNQQKMLMARELRGSPELLLVAQPTRGVDFSSSATIHQVLLENKKRGCGILLISSDLQELLFLSDRVLVMSAGRILGESSKQPHNLEKIGAWMGGVQ